MRLLKNLRNLTVKVSQHNEGGIMIIGLMYILAGLILIIFPQILAFMVAFIFILTGISMMYMSRYYKRTSHRFNDSYMDFMFRL